MPTEVKPTFKRDKFKTVVHFICDRCKPEELGNVKLHKILYFSDMLTFLSKGEPLTGVDYRKQQFGPTATHLSWALSELQREGVLIIKERDYYGFAKKDYISISRPRSMSISNEEAQLLSDVIDFVCAKTAKEISELSHDAAWHAAEMGELIPYHAAFGLLPAELTELDIEEAKVEAQGLRPLIDAH